MEVKEIWWGKRTTKESEKTRVSVFIDDDLLARLDESRSGDSRSVYIQRLLDENLPLRQKKTNS